MSSIVSYIKKAPLNTDCNLGQYKIIMDSLKIPRHPQISNLGMADPKMVQHCQFHIQATISIVIPGLIHRLDCEIDGLGVEITEYVLCCEP